MYSVCCHHIVFIITRIMIIVCAFLLYSIELWSFRKWRSKERKKNLRKKIFILDALSSLREQIAAVKDSSMQFVIKHFRQSVPRSSSCFFKLLPVLCRDHNFTLIDCFSLSLSFHISQSQCWPLIKELGAVKLWMKKQSDLKGKINFFLFFAASFSSSLLQQQQLKNKIYDSIFFPWHFYYYEDFFIFIGGFSMVTTPSWIISNFIDSLKNIIKKFYSNLIFIFMSSSPSTAVMVIILFIVSERGEFLRDFKLKTGHWLLWEASKYEREDATRWIFFL